MLQQTKIQTASSFSPQFRNLYYEKYILTYLFNISLTSIIVNSPNGNELEGKPISQLQREPVPMLKRKQILDLMIFKKAKGSATSASLNL